MTSRSKRAILSGFVALALVGAVFMGSAFTTATAASGLSPLEVAQVQKANCQLLYARSSGNQRERARLCVVDQQKIIDLLSTSTPSPTATATPTATTPAPTTAPPTTTTAPPTTTTPPVTTPPPTTTTPPTSMNNCLAHPGACGWPDAASTGVTGSLTVVNGDVNITVAGTVYQGKDVRGCIHVRAANVVIRNVNVVCGQNFTAAIANESNSLLVVEDVTLSCNWHGQSATGVWGNNTRVLRADISGCENGFDMYRDWWVEDSYIHDLFDDEPAHTDGTQVVATGGSGAPGGNIHIIHNTWMVSGNTTSAVEADHCACTTLEIRGNLISGAPNATTSSGPAYMIYCPMASATSTGVTVTGNRFGLLGPKAPNGNQLSPWGRGSNCGRFLWSGNVDDASGFLVNP
jgi:hypothetical protein